MINDDNDHTDLIDNSKEAPSSSGESKRQAEPSAASSSSSSSSSSRRKRRTKIPSRRSSARGYLVGLMDDASLCGGWAEALGMYDGLLEECDHRGYFRGMSTSPPKCKVVWRHNRPVPDHIRDACKSRGLVIREGKDGAVCLGAYFGPKHYVASDVYNNSVEMRNMREWCASYVRKSKRFFDALAHPRMSAQVAYMLLQRCVNHRLSYFISTHPPSWTVDALQLWQDMVDELCVAKFGFIQSELHKHTVSPVIWLPARSGGLGFKCVQLVDACKMYVTSALYASPEISRVINIRNSESSYYRSISVAWDVITNYTTDSRTFVLQQAEDSAKGRGEVEPSNIISRVAARNLLSQSIDSVMEKFERKHRPRGFAKQINHYIQLANANAFTDKHPRGSPCRERLIECCHPHTSIILHLSLSIPEFALTDVQLIAYLRHRAGLAPWRGTSAYPCRMCKGQITSPDHAYQCPSFLTSRTECHNYIVRSIASFASLAGAIHHTEPHMDHFITRRVRSLAYPFQSGRVTAAALLAATRIDKGISSSSSFSSSSSLSSAAAAATPSLIGMDTPNTAKLIKQVEGLRPDGHYILDDTNRFYDASITCATGKTHCEQMRRASFAKPYVKHMNIADRENQKAAKYATDLRNVGRQLGDVWQFSPFVMSSHGVIGDKSQLMLIDLADECNRTGVHLGKHKSRMGHFIASLQVALCKGNASIYMAQLTAYNAALANTYVSARHGHLAIGTSVDDYKDHDYNDRDQRRSERGRGSSKRRRISLVHANPRVNSWIPSNASADAIVIAPTSSSASSSSLIGKALAPKRGNPPAATRIRIIIGAHAFPGVPMKAQFKVSSIIASYMSHYYGSDENQDDAAVVSLITPLSSSSSVAHPIILLSSSSSSTSPAPSSSSSSSLSSFSPSPKVVPVSLSLSVAAPVPITPLSSPSLPPAPLSVSLSSPSSHVPSAM